MQVTPGFENHILLLLKIRPGGFPDLIFTDMAKVIESEKGFKLIECSRNEVVQYLGGYGICDSCNNTEETGIYIAVLNHWYCPKCFSEWHKTARNYESDRPIEERNFEHYKNALGILKQEAATEILKIIEVNLAEIEEKEKKYNGNGFILATDELDYCIVDNGKGINGTNVAAHLVDPYIFDRRIIALENQKRIKATNGRGEMKFQVWKAPEYWKAVKEQYSEMIKTIKGNSNL